MFKNKRKFSESRIMIRSLALLLAFIFLLGAISEPVKAEPLLTITAKSGADPLSVLGSWDISMTGGDEENTEGYSCIFPFLSPADADSYPALEESLSELRTVLNQAASDRLKAAKSQSKADAVQLDIIGSVTRADSNYFCYFYRPQYHLDGELFEDWVPNHYRSAVYNSQSGEKLGFADLSAGDDALIKALAEHIQGEDNRLSDEELLKVLKDVVLNKDNPAFFFLSNVGLTVFLPGRCWGKRISSSKPVTLLYSEYADAFADGVTDVPATSMESFVSLYDGHYFLPGDQETDLDLYTEYEEDSDEISSLRLDWNGRSYRLSVGGLVLNPFLIRTEKDTLLYLEIIDKDGFCTTHCSLLTDKGPRHVDYVERSVANMTSDSYGYPFFTITGDPDYLRLSYNTNLFGTAAVYEVAHIGEDGLPAVDSPIALFFVPSEHQLLKDIVCRAADPEKGVTDREVSLSRGEMLTRYGVFENHVFLLRKDGTLVAVEVDEEELSVDGTPLEKLFSELHFSN